MILRLFAPNAGFAIAVLAVATVLTSVARADGPDYTYVGISYEWTDVKYGINPRSDNRFNNGTLQGENLDLSLGILSWLHIKSQAFGYLSGTCRKCNTELSGGRTDADMEGYKIGLGVNLGLNLIGLSENADLVLRANYLDAELTNLGNSSPASVSDDGWSAESMIRGQVSDRADVFVGYEYQRLSNVRNRDVTIGLNYRVVKGLSVLGRAIVFGNQSGFELGLRWQFGGPIFGNTTR